MTTLTRSGLMLTFFLYTCCALSQVQEEGSAGQGQTSPGGENSPAARSPDTSLYSPPAATSGSSEVPQIRQLGSLGFLSQKVGWLHWGPVYVPSAEVSQIYDRGSFGSSTENHALSIFRTSMLFDHSFRRSRIAVQYLPQLSILDGQVQSNLSNHNASFDTYYRLTPRLVFSASDQFIYYRPTELNPEAFFDIGSLGGSLPQRLFLDRRGSSILNNTQFSLSYALGYRTRLSLEPHFSLNLAKIDSEPDLPLLQRAYGATTRVDHLLAQNKSVGAFYSVILIPDAARLHGATYNTVGISYSQHIKSTLAVQLSVGGTRGTNYNQDGGFWTTYANLEISKSFHNASLTLSLLRDQNFAEFVTNSYSDRATLSYSRKIGPRTTGEIGAGYFRGSTLAGTGVSGKYANAEIGYAITEHLSWYISYTQKNQAGDALQLLSGRRNYVATGLRWVSGFKR